MLWMTGMVHGLFIHVFSFIIIFCDGIIISYGMSLIRMTTYDFLTKFDLSHYLLTSHPQIMRMWVLWYLVFIAMGIYSRIWGLSLHSHYSFIDSAILTFTFFANP